MADEVFDTLEKFAGYGFNRSHSAAYAWVSYQTAYLKANYPVEFMSAVMSNEVANMFGLLLNSGWYWTAMYHGWSGSSAISTNFPSGVLPEITSPRSERQDSYALLNS